MLELNHFAASAVSQLPVIILRPDLSIGENLNIARDRLR
jgi:hypothetical protein